MSEMNWKWLKSLTAMTAALACSAAIGVGAAMADDDDDDDKPVSYPYLKGEVEFEIESGDTFRADDRDEEVSESEFEVTAELEFHFSQYFVIFNTLVIEQTVEAEDGKDSHFERHGLYVEELYGQFALGHASVFGGKFNVNFGRAWDDAPGIYGSDFAEDGYEFTERVGFGASTTRQAGGLGEVTITAAVFKSDTSQLSNSAFNQRGQLDIDDGGYGNTETLESFNIAVDGGKLPGFPGLSYHFGYIHQAKGRVGDADPADFARLDDQNGFVFGLYGEREYNSVKFEWLLEYAWFDNYLIEDEEAVEDISFFTAGGKVTLNKFDFSASYTYRPFELVSGEEFEDHLITFNVGYEIRDDLHFDIAYKFETDEEEDAHTIGVKLSKEIEFNTGK